MKVSVVVPVYNVASYIERCARSLFEQSLKDLEILFIDDCTPDNSIELIRGILANYPEREKQIRIIKMSSNSGQAAVRRQGIIEARGEYVIHCDGDDWVDKELYETMYLKAVEDNADIVVCDESLEHEGKSVLNMTVKLPNNCKEVVKEWYKRPIGMFCHNKLVKRCLYVEHDILPWEGLNMWEDNGLLTRLFFYGGKLSQIHGPVYHYNRANVSAITSGYGIKQVEQMIGVAEHLTDFFNVQEDASDFEKTIKAFQFLAKINLVTDSWKNLERYYTIFPDSESIISELSTNAFSSKGKVRFYFVKWHLSWLFVLLFKCARLLRS